MKARRRTLWMGWLLGGAMQTAVGLAYQDSFGGLEGYCAYLRNGHWLNTRWWMWAGVWVIGLVIFALLYFREKP